MVSIFSTMTTLVYSFPMYPEDIIKSVHGHLDVNRVLFQINSYLFIHLYKYGV